MKGVIDISLEIIEGHDPGSYFWIFPVKILRNHDIWRDEVEQLPDEISIEEDYVHDFLLDFFNKYFDDDLDINEERIMFFADEENDGHSYINGLDWNLEYNFYTYDTIRLMLEDIEKTAELLVADYENDALQQIKKHISNYYMAEYGSGDYKIGKEKQPQDFKNNAYIIVDFYTRFVDRMRKMLMHDQNANIICIEGP